MKCAIDDRCLLDRDSRCGSSGRALFSEKIDDDLGGLLGR